MRAAERTVILTPKQCAWEVARAFGRTLPSIVVVQRGGQVVHTELAPVDPRRRRGVAS